MESLAHAVMAVSFALLGGTQKVDANVSVTHPTPTTAQIRITETNHSGSTIKKYDEEMTKLMHLVVISNDFTEFQHVHPTYDAATGAFLQTIPVDPKKSYYLYADTTPRGFGQQVFRETIKSSIHSGFRSVILSSNNPAKAGPDVVTLNTSILVAGKAQDVKLEITRNGKPATGLQPYLGAAGHAVFINTQTLDYVHVHPMLQGAMEMGDDDDMSSMPHMKMDVAGPHLVLHVPALPAGAYRLWFQFRDGDAVRVAPFIITATKNSKVASNTMVAPLELRRKYER